MAIDLGTTLVKGLYNKSSHWMGPKVAAPLPPPDNMPWGPTPQQNPAYIDPRIAPNTAGFPPPRGPSLPQGHPPPQPPMTPMQEPPVLGPQPPPMQTRAQSRRATIGRPRKPEGSQQPSAASVTSEPAGTQMLRMMNQQGRR